MGVLVRRVGNGRNGGTGIMGGRQDHRKVVADLVPDRRQKRPYRRTRAGQRFEQARGKIQQTDKVGVPAAALAGNQLCRGSVGIFLHFFPGQQKVEVIRQHQKIPGLFQTGRLQDPVGRQLIDGVEGLLLDASSFVQIALTDAVGNDLIHTFGPAVAVSIAGADRFIVCVQQAVIDRPGIDPHGAGDLAQKAALFHTFQNRGKQGIGIPDPMGLSVGHGHHLIGIGKAVDLFGNHTGAFHMGKDMPPAGSPYIDCQIVFHFSVPLFWLPVFYRTGSAR